MKAVFITVVPSPYQRDLFEALAERIELKVFYLEASSPDSPWPRAELRPFEHVLPGFWIPFAGVRWHFNAGLPDFSYADFVVVSSYTSWTGQCLMRRRLQRRRWLFWGERFRHQERAGIQWAQRKLTAPLAGATAIVAVGIKAQQDYRRRFPDLPNFNVPYHCSLSAFLGRTRPPRNGAPCTFLFCGQMIRRKGVDLLLNAFDQMLHRGIAAELMLVGRAADLPAFLAVLSPLARRAVRFEGFQPPEKLPEYFQRADAIVLPSRHDGWGVVLNQALGAGLALICSDAVGGAGDLVEENVNGTIFPEGDVIALRHSLERLATAPELVARWGEASRRKAMNWTHEAGADKWIQVFHKLRETPKLPSLGPVS